MSVNLSILTENGNEITKYGFEGRTLIEGRKGSNYKIKLTNSHYSRKSCIVSIDGLDVIEGKPASKHSQGYLLNGYETLVIDGWRISDEQVRKFVFSDKTASYTSKVGFGTDNTGVIGLMVFDEKVVYKPNPSVFYIGTPVWDNQSYYLKSTSENLNMSASAVASGQSSLTQVQNMIYGSAVLPTSLGTGMGEKADSKVTKVNFERADNPVLISSIYYFSRKELENMGVIKKPQKNISKWPTAFTGYCKEV